MEKKQSSIDWFVEQLVPVEQYDRVMDMIEEAKAMHKEDMESAYFNGSADRMNDEGSFEQYYNESFGGNNE